jgi:diguanylate cyclase (GGDEF)-like protein
MSWVIILAADAALLGAFCAVAWVLLRNRATVPRAREPGVEHQLLHDSLTKLPNRTLFRDRLERALARSVRRRSACAVLSVDIDRFNLVSRSLGPARGDEVLCEVAARLDAAVRPEDTVARTGGDQFMVLLESVRGPDEAAAVAERVAEALAPAIDANGSKLYVSASMGIALGWGGRDRPEDVLQNADVAVHRAKEAGGARTEIFRQEMNPHPLERLGLETDLRRAVGAGEFVVEYQPIVELAGGEICGLEALVRWEHPERGRIEPDAFIPVAEETGLILPIGRLVLATACAQAAEWARLRPVRVCVNLSHRELQQPRVRLVDEVASALAGSGLQPDALCLEMTETGVMDDADAAVEGLRDLKQLGVHVGLDDFGTGYSSLNHLRRFPLDLVKIDRSFIAELTLDDEGEAIVRALIEVCHALHAQVLAEGVETPDQARRLLELGADYAQGRAFSAPLTAAKASDLLASGGTLEPAPC